MYYIITIIVSQGYYVLNVLNIKLTISTLIRKI